MSKVIFTVSELNTAAKRLLEDHFTSIWVEGEISNLSKHSSGHMYFRLKDLKSQISCALFRGQNISIREELRNGLLVQLQAKVSIYTDRGDYQLIVERLEMAGEGLLKKAYDALVLKLTKEGLFDEQWKKPIPLFPNKIGVVTSPTGAAIRDILSVLNRRFPCVPVFIYPTKVQGNEAAPEIAEAIKRANRHGLVDVLILARGGGSLEDLWPFNDEALARVIFESKLPIVTGVGHEVDFTIADFVADKRAPTPSAAAELVTPNQYTLLQQLSTFEGRLVKEITKYLQYLGQRLDWLQKQIKHPGQEIRHQLQQFANLDTNLKKMMLQLLKEKDLILQNLMSTLNAVSPLATLSRGYAIVSAKKSGAVIRSIKQAEIGDNLNVQLQDGNITVEVV